VEVNVPDARFLAGEMVVDRRHVDVLTRKLGEHALQFAAEDDEVAHHRGILWRAPESRPGPQAEGRGYGQVADVERHIAARQIVSLVAVGHRRRRVEDGGDGVPRGCGGALTA
jgi:hypothetical protein